ncbi:23S rRNA (adenine(2030)-N(6))-methyltransferase RlmJ [Gimibacter soli]|uniref:Ribosomal RNA large subunit methyltransferase J n=1 Tax=Gimibacter soli TaxID=3024400 RepID=A0AAF0BL32_9PROT|nr:23S rRNA (adenine(2030)-N(6))-methyltransferase RlmJ [Gimibacter soli]WCL53657.1 23S rRNA (adenine(2030)-N(6))-methyltransferase RlmJ [Gimibacter soli]
MLSYQHSYHAGNLPDIHKHAVLATFLKAMTEKPKAMTVVETHAGRGLYDLGGMEAQKTGEASEGIVPLLKKKLLPADHPFLTAVAATRKAHGASAYPGSPLIAQHLLREGDILHLMELHPQEHAALRETARAPGVNIHRRDGYEGVLSVSPPTPRRGLVLIDPSYEIKSEYMEAASFIKELHAKWPEATILLWYPILKAGLHELMLDALEGTDLPGVWHDQVLFSDTNLRMLGSGLFAVNRPYGIDESLGEISAAVSRLAGNP